MMSKTLITCCVVILISISGAESELKDLLLQGNMRHFQDEIEEPGKLQSEGKVRPIIFMHGIFGEGHEYEFANKYIPSKLPGAVVYSINMFTGLQSALKMELQLHNILPVMQKIMDNHTDTGVTLLCYSQGGVICRAAVQMLPTHNVHTMITLSSPLNGQYGVTSFVKKYANYEDRSGLWKFWYSGLGQWISIGDYWNDPHHQQEFSDPKHGVLLAKLNNQTGHADSEDFKANFMRLQRLVMIGGPDDKVITPWQSAQLGFYDKDEQVLPYEGHSWYAGDDFGLRSLDAAGKVIRHTHAGVHHTHWYKNSHVFDHSVLPYL